MTETKRSSWGCVETSLSQKSPAGLGGEDDKDGHPESRKCDGMWHMTANPEQEPDKAHQR